LNYGAELAIDASAAAIGSELNLEEDYIRSKISISQRATPSRFTTIVRAKRRGLLMPRYDAKQMISGGKRAGVSVQIKKNGARKNMKSAFFVKLKRGNQAGAGSLGVAYRPEDGQAWKPEHQSSIDNLGYAVMHSASVSQALETLSEDHKVNIDNESLISFFINRIKK